jgi:urease accessory protein
LLGGIVERGIFMNSCITRIAAAAAVLIAMTGAATAHPGHADASGFTHGFLHPLGGLDHVLAMVAVGLYAALLGGRALWLVPATFVTVMALGGALGAAGYALPYTEIGIALSVVVLGVAVALRVSLPTLAAMALAGVFAVFHGHAHGAEMPQSLSGYEYAAGFLGATALLHGAGIALGLAMGKLSELGGRRVVQAAGGAMALAGLALLVAVH